MLARSRYDQTYVDACRARMGAQMASYRALTTAAGKGPGGKAASLGRAIASFEPVFFNNMVIVLDGHFIHRTRAVELKDGNPLNEVRMLSDSLMNHDGALHADPTIKYDADRSVLRYRVGDRIEVDEGGFERLSAAFFADLERKFVGR